MTFNHKIISSAASALMLVLAATAAAWACTPQTRLFAPDIPKGPAGTQVTVKGDGVAAGIPVTIEWGGLRGAKRAETKADATGTFSAALEVPQTSPGIYFILATPRAIGVAVARQPYLVTGAAGASTVQSGAGSNSELWSGFATLSSSVGSSDTATTPIPAGTRGIGLGIALLTAGATGAIATLTVGARKRSKASA